MDDGVVARTLEKVKGMLETRRYDMALRELKLIEDDPAENPELSYFLGLCYTKLEDYDNALLYLEQVVTYHWNLLLVYQCRMILSYIYSITGRFQLAAYELEKLMDSGYESVQAYSAYGYILYSQGRTDDALEHLQKALTLDPENPNALNSLGYIMAEKDLDNATAVNYCKSAVKQKPDNPAYLDSLGWALFKGGRLEEAREYLRRALSLSGGDHTIATHMRELLSSET